MPETVPLDADLEAAARLGRAAILGRAGLGDRAAGFADQFEAAVRDGRRSGALYRDGGRALGVAVWSPHGRMGVELNLWYLVPAVASADAYAAFYGGMSRLGPAIVFVVGELPGVTSDEEARLMEGLGLARYGRLEMRWADGSTLRPVSLPPGGRLRSVGPSDTAALGRLHADAYRDRFDRYLFLETDDPHRDAERMVHDLFDGRWGEFDPVGSRGLEIGGRLVAAVLSVRRPEGVLIADVMVDPERQGRGFGAAVMVDTLAALRAAGLGPVYLNVTVGNAPAERLYRGLGFVPSLGPSRDWYDPRRIPARP